MNIYIKKVKNSKGQEKEWLWINYTINGKRFRKPLDMENTKSNYKRAENEILPILQYKLLNGELNQDNGYNNYFYPTYHFIYVFYFIYRKVNN